MRLLGQMSEEERLEFEQETGIRTAGALRIVEEARATAEQMIQTAIREVQEVIGPHGSVTRVQAGGVRVSRSGIAVFEDGIMKTVMESDGDFHVGSDTGLPATTSFSVFTNEQTYNNELMGAGDLLIGDNTSGALNVWYDADEGELHFRVGRLTSFFMDTLGGIKTNDPSSVTGGDLNLVNEATGKAIKLYIELTDLSTPYLAWKENPSVANATYLEIAKGAAGGRVAFGLDHFIDFLNTAGTGSATVYFNERNKDIDFNVQGATDDNLLYIDAGLDAVAIGGAADGDYKLTVYGNINLSAGSNFYIGEENIITTLQNGWINAAGTTWTRTGDHTFTMSGDVTAAYRKGTKVRYKDGGAYEYGVVASSSHSAGTTTITLITNTDYAMAAATITDNYISYIENPEGWPDWFNYTPTLTGFSADPTSSVYRWRAQNKSVKVAVRQGADGTSNATSFTITIPVAAATITNMAWDGTAGGRDNGAALTTMCRLSIVSAATAMSIFPNGSGTALWTNANGKRITAGIIEYEM